MADEYGTRAKALTIATNVSGRSDTRSHTRDLGLAKYVNASITFTAATGRAAGANGTFTSTFAVNDQVLVQGTNLNDGLFVVTALDAINAAYLVLSPAPKDEGPLTAILRTP